MSLDLTHTLIPAILMMVIVLAFEEWAFFKARTKVQRAVITGIAVFVLLILLNLVAGPSH